MEEELKQYTKNLEKLAEERTKKLASTALYVRSLIEASLDPLVTISAEGKITDVNKATELATGCSREELIGTDFSKYFTDPQKARAGYRQVFADAFVRDYPLELKHKSGRITEVLYNAAVYRNEAGEIEGVFAAARDVTERKKAERLAEENAKKLKDVERLAAIGATAGMVGHDIRNPLQSMTSDVYLANSELASLPESEQKSNIKESLDEIGKAIDYVNKIVADLQDYARPLKPLLEETDLKGLVEDLMLRNDIPKNIKFSSRVAEDAETIRADHGLLKRILGNLVTNAVQAMPEGGKLTILAKREATGVAITVQDTGVGIPEEVSSKMFTPLFTTKSKGQGLGLAVVKRLTETMGGKVTFESEVGKGTKFIVSLPSTTGN
jgi:PAS domain S-box-containing protein